jgi:hypothetical protein
LRKLLTVLLLLSCSGAIFGLSGRGPTPNSSSRGLALAAVENNAPAIQEETERYLGNIGRQTAAGKHLLAVTDTCPSVSLGSCPVNHSAVMTTSCVDNVISSYEDLYTFPATAGQIVTVTMSSPQFLVYLVLLRPNGAIAAFGSTASPLGGGVSTSSLTYLIPTSGTYTIDAETLESVTSGQPNTGPYSISVTGCNGSAPTGILTLLGTRFQVTAAYTATGSSGQGNAVSLSGDTGYFWFFAPNAVELVVKMIDGRAVDNHFWVFAGGLTDVDVVISVRDTVTGTTKTYHNPQGTAFAPIQDTSAF